MINSFEQFLSSDELGSQHGRLIAKKCVTPYRFYLLTEIDKVPKISNLI